MIILKMWQRRQFKKKFLAILVEVIESVYSEIRWVSGTKARGSITSENSEYPEDTP